MKWNFCAAEKSEHKYIICNADEGEPGTFKDRVILRDFADLVFEGMTIGGRAIGASMGIVYLRAEYAYLRAHLNERHPAAPRGRPARQERRRRRGLRLRHRRGARRRRLCLRRRDGAHRVARGLPRRAAQPAAVPGRRRLPQPPDVVNNVETLASVACIFAKGTDWFKGFGTDKSTGYKLFSISGDCDQPGVYEFPWGITIADLLKEVGGDGAKAVQIGGASGVCVPGRTSSASWPSKTSPPAARSS